LPLACKKINFLNFNIGGAGTNWEGGSLTMKKTFYQQNDGKLSKDPPVQLGAIAASCWRKIVPFLETTDKVHRIDSFLVENYCSQYEIYREAYEDIKENGIQSKVFKSLQDNYGAVVGQDFVGFKKNPAVGTLKDSITLLNSIGMQLGLSPKGRQNLSELANQSKEEPSIADLLNGDENDED